MAKFVTAAEAVQQIKDGATIATSGFVGGLIPEAVLKEMEASFRANNTPKDMTVIYAAGQGDSGERGLNHLGDEGMLKRIIGGHFNLTPRLGELVNNNKVEAYNLPQGTLSQWFRDIAGRRPGTITKVGLRPSGSATSRAAVPARLPKSASVPSLILVWKAAKSTM